LNDKLEILGRISSALISSLDLEEIFKVIISGVRNGIGFDRAGLFLVDENSNIIQGVFGTDVSGNLVQIQDQIFPVVDGDNYFADIALGKIKEFYTENATKTLPLSQKKYLANGVRQNAIVALRLDGKVIGMIAIDNVISNKKFTPNDLQLLKIFADQAAMAIRNAQIFEELKKLDKLKMEFFSTASHEIRSPLSIIKEAAIILESENKEQPNRIVSIISSNVDRILGFVDELLDFSKIEAVGMMLNQIELNVAELIREIVSEIKSQSDRKNIEIEIDFGKDLPDIDADETRIRQLMLNLILNAIKYTNNNGKIRISGYAKDNNIVIDVTDNGIGIPKEFLEKIFAKFYQVDKKITKTTRGVGLGLAICRAIVNAHKGSIWAVSNGPDQGSSFYVSLPIKKKI